ncbi:MAG: hypothetical protein C4332_13610 [Meiothermus sp.]
MKFAYDVLQAKADEHIARLRQEAEVERSLRQKVKEAVQVLASARRRKQRQPTSEAPSQRSA